MFQVLVNTNRVNKKKKTEQAQDVAILGVASSCTRNNSGIPVFIGNQIFRVRCTSISQLALVYVCILIVVFVHVKKKEEGKKPISEGFQIFTYSQVGINLFHNLNACCSI